MNLRFPRSFILKLRKAMAETPTAVESQPKRKTQRCCGYEALSACGRQGKGVFKN